VIDPDQQERLYAASPYNAVRLILAKGEPADTDQHNRYTRTRQTFQDWREAGVLRQDEVPAVYVVRHRFTGPLGAATRLGVFALLGLDADTPRAVLKHEATLAGPKVDRAKLLAAVPANLEPIFCVYPDAGGGIQRRLEQVIAGPPTLEARLGNDEVGLWCVTDEAVVAALRAALAAQAVLIADGHHRFEVAWSQRARYDRVMAYFASMADPGLVVHPIDRVTRRLAGWDRAALTGLCTVEPAADADALERWLQHAEARGCFGLRSRRGWFRVQVRPEVLARWLLSPPVPLPVATLDVSILHGLLLPPLGLGHAAAGTDVGQAEAWIRYTGDRAQALRDAEADETRAAWLLRGIPLSQVYALAAQGFTLAPKSTYFYPKVPSGLVINLLEEPAAHPGVG